MYALRCQNPTRATNVLLASDASEPLEAYVDRVEFAAAACIFREGSPSDCCYLVDSGEIRIEVRSHEVDSDAVLGYMSSPSILGELGLLDGLPRSASAFAESAVTARRLSSEGLIASAVRCRPLDRRCCAAWVGMRRASCAGALSM